MTAEERKGRLPAGDGLRDRGRHRKHLFRPVYPVAVAAMSLVVGFLFLPETKDVDIKQI